MSHYVFSCCEIRFFILPLAVSISIRSPEVSWVEISSAVQQQILFFHKICDHLPFFVAIQFTMVFIIDMLFTRARPRALPDPVLHAKGTCTAQ